MTPEHALVHIIRPGLRLLTEISGKVSMQSQAAEVMLVAIGLQESGFRHRHQIGGPAHGFWQFERNGGVKGVLRHHSTSATIGAYLEELELPTDVEGVFEILPWSEMAQVGLARLLLWSDPAALPLIGFQSGAWDFYLRNWRPGKPRSAAWPAHYETAVEVCS
jgi:hypothetical protein